MLSFTSEDNFEITGRGTVFTLRCPIDITEPLIGRRVLIDGWVWLQPPPTRTLKGENIGILIRTRTGSAGTRGIADG